MDAAAESATDIDDVDVLKGSKVAVDTLNNSIESRPARLGALQRGVSAGQQDPTPKMEARKRLTPLRRLCQSSKPSLMKITSSRGTLPRNAGALDGPSPDKRHHLSSTSNFPSQCATSPFTS